MRALSSSRGPSSTSSMDASGLAACFARARYSVFRLEAQPAYDVPTEADAIAAFTDGRPLPERSVRTNGYLQLVAAARQRGVTWTRVRVVDEPLTDYQRFQLAVYPGSVEAGENVLIAGRGVLHGLAAPVTDFWMIDAGHWGQRVIAMHYTPTGVFTGLRRVRHVAPWRKLADIAISHAIPLDQFLAGRQAAR